MPNAGDGGRRPDQLHEGVAFKGEQTVFAHPFGHIGGAGLDVYELEPAMVEGLAACDNAILLPHLGSATRATRDKMATMAATNAIAMLRGDKAPNCVNDEVYDSVQYAARIGS